MFATKCISRQNARKWDIAHATTKESNHHISLFCDKIYLFHWSLDQWKFQYGRVCLVTIHVLSLWLKQQYLSALSYFKLTLLANGTDVWQMDKCRLSASAETIVGTNQNYATPCIVKAKWTEDFPMFTIEYLLACLTHLSSSFHPYLDLSQLD